MSVDDHMQVTTVLANLTWGFRRTKSNFHIPLENPDFPKLYIIPSMPYEIVGNPSKDPSARLEGCPGKSQQLDYYADGIVVRLHGCMQEDRHEAEL